MPNGYEGGWMGTIAEEEEAKYEGGARARAKTPEKYLIGAGATYKFTPEDWLAYAQGQASMAELEKAFALGEMSYEEQAFWLAYAQGQAPKAKALEAKKKEQEILARGIPTIIGAIHTPMSKWGTMTPAEREGLTWYDYDRLAKEYRETEEKRTQQILGTKSKLRDELAKLWYQYPSIRRETGMGAVSWAESEIWGALPDWARQITSKVGEAWGTETGGIRALEQQAAAPASQWLPSAIPATTPTVAPKPVTPTQKRWQYPPPARWLMY